VVGRLVQQPEVGLHHEQAREGNPAALAAAHRRHHLVVALGRKAHALQDLVGPVLQLVAAAVLELRLHVGEPRQELVGLVAGRVLQLVMDVVDLDLQGRNLRIGGDDGLADRAAFGELRVLLEGGDAHAALLRQRAFMVVVAEDDAEERGLAGAVGADEADAHALGERELGVAEQEAGSVLLAQLRRGQEAHGGTLKESAPRKSRAGFQGRPGGLNSARVAAT
jgi:hypothetical protein